MAKEKHTNSALTIEVDDREVLNVCWRGQSTGRDPGRFILPILTSVLERSTLTGQAIVLDFRELEYMNSSTITPIIRILERARRGSNHVEVVYLKDQSWQMLSFTALEVFNTEDGRIQIQGM